MGSILSRQRVVMKQIVHVRIQAVSGREVIAIANRVPEQCGRSVLTYEIEDRTSKAMYERASSDNQGGSHMMGSQHKSSFDNVGLSKDYVSSVQKRDDGFHQLNILEEHKALFVNHFRD